MAEREREKATFPVFAILMVLLLIAAIGFGIMMFTSERDEITDDGRPVAQEESTRDRAGDGVENGLTLAEYTFDPSGGEISGSVMNGTDRHFVNIQVEFVYFDLQGDSAGVVRDTTRELMAGETWRFNIPVDAENGVSDVSQGRVSGSVREGAGAGEAREEVPSVPPSGSVN